MNFKPLSIDDKSIFSEFEYICADYVFSYLFMYRNLYSIKIYYDDKTVIIYSETNNPCFYMPLGDTGHGIDLIVNNFSNKGINATFSKIPEDFIGIFADRNIKLKEDRDSFDYIYRNSDLSGYKTKLYRKQRNNLSNFIQNAAPRYTDNFHNYKNECKEFMYKHYTDPDILGPTSSFIDNIDYFDCKGGIVWEDNEIQAFCIYEKVSQNTVLSHVELTNNNHRGVHAYLINEMSSRIDEEYINKEDDVGLPGLRRFKISYNPCSMIKKYTSYND